MTNPIEWTTTEPQPNPADLVRYQRVKIETWITGPGYDSFLRDATPSDLVAALAAMGEGEREEVLRASGAAASFDMQAAIITDLRTRLKEATRLHSEAESSLDVERALRGGDARYADAKLNESIARAEKAERERDEARAERDCSYRLRAGMLPDTRRELGALGCADVAVAARRVVAERDRALASLATVRHDLKGTRSELEGARERIDALRAQLAERKGRELPLAPNSEWSGDAIVDGRGTIQEYEGGYVTVRAHVGSVEARITLIAADLAALLHRAGVV